MGDVAIVGDTGCGEKHRKLLTLCDRSFKGTFYKEIRFGRSLQCQNFVTFRIKYAHLRILGNMISFRFFERGEKQDC